ncbi:T9SS type A sorting domain-containing protein [Adhaeribacter terreus]|uniref:T9SS type A sorting domain-containing protein n=1 Tax=Adhaeribacter terreus TaxID=529703 RepID=A0ABW0E8W1_9BACT
MHKNLPQSGLNWTTLARRWRTLRNRAALGTALLFGSSLYAFNAQAQAVSAYNFAASSGTFTPLGATATQVPDLVDDEVVSTAIPIGFTFNYAGTNYTSVYATDNGILSFNPSTIPAYTNDPSGSPSGTRPLIAPLWDDHAGYVVDGAEAAYETTGAAGSRVFTFEWKNWAWDYFAPAGVITFQAKLYEATGKIEFHYRQETTPANSASATIGLVGTANGPGNFLTLNNASATPTASSTFATTNISTKPATGQIYTFTKPVSVDIATDGLASPTVVGCPNPNQTVSIAVRNAGTAPIDFSTNPLTVTASATGTNPATFTPVTVSTGILAPGASQNVVVSTNYNMSTAGSYVFSASSSITGDGFAANNAIAPVTATRTIVAPVAIPQNVNFTGFTGSNLSTLFPGWSEANDVIPTGTTSDWTSDDYANTTNANGISAKVNLYSNVTKAWMIGPKITAAATTFLKYDLALTTWAGTSAASLGSDDEVKVMVSTDCGGTWTAIRTYNSASTISNTGQVESISLGAYAGQDIIVAFYATEGSVDDAADNDIFIDNVSIISIPPVDLGATALANPVTSTGCYGNVQGVSVTIKNFGSAPLDFLTTPATITVNVTGAVTQTIPFQLLNNTLNGGNPLAIGATLTVPVGTLNMSAPGVYTFNATTTIAGDGTAANDAMPATSITVVAPTAGTASAAPASICVSGATTLSLTGQNGGDVQWQQGTSATGTFTNITSASGSSFTTPTLSQTSYYRAIVSCGANSDTSNIVTVTVNNPLVTASAGATVCSGTTATLTATPSAGATITWYSSATGGAALATGNTYSPTVTANTTYYAEASVSGGSGLTSLNAHPLTGGNGCSGGNMFNVNPISNISITGFDQNLNIAAGTSTTVTVYYKTGSYLGSETTASAWTLHQSLSVTSAGPNTATLVSINPLTLIGGQNYAIYIEADVNYTSITAPATYTNADLSIIVGAGLCGSFTSVNANRAWNGVLRYTAGCPGPRVPVAVVVNPAPATPTISASGPTSFCNGGSVVLTASSTTTGTTYQWYNNGVAITGATNATYTATAGGTFTAVASANGCSSPASAVTTVNMNTLPAVPTITAGGSTTICQGQSVALTASSTSTGVTYQWFNNGTAITGATAATYSANAAGTFTVTASNNGCTSAASTATTVTLNAIPATPTITPSGDSGQELTSSAATGNQWYLNGTAITGATAQTYQTTANGNYTVVVTDNSTTCASLPSAAVNITNTGIKGAMAGMSVSVYPNPSNGKFNVKLVGYKHDAALELYSLTGQLIVKENVKSGQEVTKLQVKNLAAGTYLLKVVSEKGVQINKLIVE